METLAEIDIFLVIKPYLLWQTVKLKEHKDEDMNECGTAGYLSGYYALVKLYNGWAGQILGIYWKTLFLLICLACLRCQMLTAGTDHDSVSHYLNPLVTRELH